MSIKIIQIYTKEEEIKGIINKIKKYSFSEFIKHKHFDFSVMEKLTDLNLLETTFPKFELIKSIELRENELGQRHYSFNYELEDGTFVVIALVLDKNPPIIINGLHNKTNYKRFEKSLKKYYKDKFI